MFVEQSALGNSTDMARYSIFRVAKVTAMYPTSNSADVVFLDGTYVTQIPILGGLCSSVFGLSYTVQPEPTTDKPVPPAEIFPEGAPQGSLPPCTVDIYCVVSSFYGPRISTGGYFIVGFLYPPLTEMKFPTDATLNSSGFDRLLVYRHASDVQITIDKNGTTSIQHPSGARITMGYENAIDGSDPLTTPVNLTQQDVNEWYHFCSNTTEPTGVVVKDSTGNNVTMTFAGGVAITDAQGDTIVVNNGNITVTNKSGSQILVDGDNITLRSVGQVNQTTNAFNLDSTTTNMTGTNYTQTALETVNITGTFAVNITSAAVINLTAPQINLNGNVNFGDAVEL